MKPSNELIYSVLLEMKEEIGEMRSDLRTVKEQTIKTNGRVNAIERFNENLRGKIAVVAVIVSAAGTLAVSWIKKELGI